MATKPLLTLKPAALAHFANLIAKESAIGQMHLRIEVNNPGTLKADVGITFCPLGDQDPDDLAINFPHFILYVDQNSVAALRDATIDYKTNEQNLGGQLSVSAPFIKGTAPDKSAPLHERVQYIIDSEINPNLASHGGFVSLVDIVDNSKVIVRFGGGCHGCGMADVTLKSGIEKTLKAQCTDITAVLDVTDHELGENPYYARGS